MKATTATFWSIATISCFICLTSASYELTYGNDTDLTHFITRPDLKAPVLDVIKHKPDSISPGYIFTAPYVKIFSEPHPPHYYQPCQTGPHIYDGDGELVWSGACDASNTNVADFRPVFINGSWHLSSIRINQKTNESKPPGFGEILSNNYRAVVNVDAPNDVQSFNMYELNIVDEGKSALMILFRPEFRDVSMLEQRVDPIIPGGWVGHMGFKDVDINTGKVNFEWWALDHLRLTDSTADVTVVEHLTGPAWNFLDLNSVDKNSQGDYLVSARNMDAIYLISGKDGSIIWQLGGKNSFFRMRNFGFSRQNHARFLDPATLPIKINKELEYISFVDNSVDQMNFERKRDTVSSVLIVALDRASKVAKLMVRIERPDGKQSIFGGNTNVLPNGNIFASWSGNSYLTEHHPEQELVMEARFRSYRFSTYRAYKSDFKGIARERPVAKCLAYGVRESNVVTVCHVSWNGDTEVRQWRFYKSYSKSERELWGSTKRRGFETRTEMPGYVETVFVEGLDASGEVLGKLGGIEVEKVVPWTTETMHDEL